MTKTSQAGTLLLVCCCWITGQYAFVINSLKNTHSKNEDVRINVLQKQKIPEGENLVVGGNVTPIPRSAAYKGARTASGKHGYVASASTLKLCGNHIERNALHVCSDVFPVDITTWRVLQKIRSRSVLAQKRYSTENAKPPRVLCMVYTSQTSHSSKLNAIVNTWAKDCDGFLAASNVTEPCLGAADLIHDGPEKYDNMWQKVRSMWAYVLAHYIEDYDFFHICGDDTYFIVDNLRQYLWSLHHNTSNAIVSWNTNASQRVVFCGWRASGQYFVEQALDIFLTDNVDSREDVFASSLLEKVGITLTHAMDKNGLLIYMHINPPTFVEKYSFKDNAKLLGTNKVSGATASIHVNYNRQGIDRAHYSDFDIVEIMHRYHDVLKGKCDHVIPRTTGLPDLSNGGVIIFFHLPKTGGSSLRHLAKSNNRLDYYSNEHRSMNVSKNLISQWAQTPGLEKLGKTKFFEFHWSLEPCKYSV